ncbi:MAG: class 1 fructose-bisphosphatase, partial [Burkholderiales bacterium]|nr:class 1 fructose-bisphosphatase [Burkholderiales bacterium]
LIEQLRDDAALSDLSALLIDVAAAIKSIAAVTARGALGGHLDAAELRAGGEQTRQRFNQIAHDAIVGQCEWGGLVAGMLSEELRDLCPIPREYPRGNYLLCFDPLDGSSNLDVNVAVGSIFSVLRHSDSQAPGPADFLRPGTEQVAAGYAIYGPTTMFMLTVGDGVAGFTLDPNLGEFKLTHPAIRVPEDTQEFAINSSNSRFWEPPVKRYVDECLAGKTGPRGKDFNMRWIASLVAEAHRILMRGGVFLYPRDTRDPGKPGRLRLLYEASPVGFLMEQAGGRASTGRQPVLGVVPSALHQRIGLVFGSKHEVERIERYHRDPAAREAANPLFAERSLFRD